MCVVVVLVIFVIVLINLNGGIAAAHVVGVVVVDVVAVAARDGIEIATPTAVFAKAVTYDASCFAVT